MKLRSMTREKLGRLNSATKYPSILTYHVMGERGQLTEEVAVPFDHGDELSLTEKVDGTNARVILFPGGDYVIGSREEFLHARGDLIPNPQLGIVDALDSTVLKLQQVACFMRNYSPDMLYVFYGEVYGGNIGKSAKQYTTTGDTDFRLFDIASFSEDRLEELLEQSREDISSWRQQGGQSFYPIDVVCEFAEQADIRAVPFVREPELPPRGLFETYAWLTKSLKWGGTAISSAAGIDCSAGGRPEGVVLRTPDRSKIAKMRLEDYRRTLKGKV